MCQCSVIFARVLSLQVYYNSCMSTAHPAKCQSKSGDGPYAINAEMDPKNSLFWATSENLNRSSLRPIT